MTKEQKCTLLVLAGWEGWFMDTTMYADIAMNWWIKSPVIHTDGDGNFLTLVKSGKLILLGFRDPPPMTDGELFYECDMRGAPDRLIDGALRYLIGDAK